MLKLRNLLLMDDSFDEFAAMSSIIRDLALTDPVNADDNGVFCVFCLSDQTLALPMTDPGAHEVTCLWRRAVEHRRRHTT